MKNLRPAEIQTPSTDGSDPRLGHLLGRASEPRVVLVGFPSDEGVARNDGRRGAAQGPDAIRRALYKMTPDAQDTARFTNLVEHTNDEGDVPVSGELERDQRHLGEIVAGFLERGVIPIILGGGHETAYGHFLGYAEASLDTAILNLDAHVDVRPLKEKRAHSGSPFRQAMEHPGDHCHAYLVAGLQPHSVAHAHLEYIEAEGGRYHFRDETNITSLSSLFHIHEGDRLMVTFDLDAVDQAFAPGVSAPCTNGLQPDFWLTAAYLAGRNEQVTSFDISEMNPGYDRDGQTARLAALTVWHFLLGLSQRP